MQEVVKLKSVPTGKKLNLVILEMQNSNAEDTLAAMFDLNVAKRSVTEEGSICYEFPKIKLWVVKEPKGDQEAEKKLLNKLKKKNWNGKLWYQLLLTIQKTGVDTMEESTRFFTEKLIPTLGRNVEEHLVVGLKVGNICLYEKDWDSFPKKTRRMRRKIGSRMLTRERLYQKHLKEMTGKELDVIAYADSKLILNPKHYLGVPFNLERLYEAVLVKIPPIKETWVTLCLREDKELWSYFYEVPGEKSEWTERFLKKLGKIFHEGRKVA